MTASVIARTKYVLLDAVNDGPELQPSCWQQYVLVLQASETADLSFSSLIWPPKISLFKSYRNLLSQYLLCVSRDYNRRKKDDPFILTRR